jgi:hypothetical protein
VRKPDLFIVGAPKCGTTALHRYLAEHPRIFMSKIKEPRFFADDFFRFVTEFDDYLELFKDATEDHLAVGEASPNYLRSAVALPRIREFSPDARLIVMVRNPVDLAYSFHSQQLVSFNEDEVDFERAWRKQGGRRRGRDIPPLCRCPAFLQYREVARLGEQLAGLYEIFDEAMVRVIVFDDLVADARRVYEDLLDFLDIPSDGRVHFPRVNPNQNPRIPMLSRFARRPPRLLIEPYMNIKKHLNWSDLGFTKWLKSVNAKPVRRPPLSAAFRHELIEEFRNDVDHLARILGRNLSHWLTAAADEPQ